MEGTHRRDFADNYLAVFVSEICHIDPLYKIKLH